MSTQNMMPSSDSGDGYSEQNKGSQGTAFIKALGDPLRLLKQTANDIHISLTKTAAVVKQMAANQKKITAGALGLNGKPAASNTVADGMGKMGGLSTQAKFGLGAAAAVLGPPALMMSMMPNTASAVTQRMGLNSLLTGPGGMGPNAILRGLNKSLAGGTTGVGSPTQAGMALTYQAGMLATTPYNMKTIMPQMAGLSAMTGGTNQQMAGAMGSINSMRFMRSGTQTRDSKGRLLPINQIINNLFRSMYGGQKITAEQAALIYNPGSPSHKTVMDAAGGDQTLFAVLAEGIRTRAMAGKNLTASQMRSADKILDIRGVPKNDPMRANFKNNAAQNKLLENTQQGLVTGYTDTVEASASLTSKFADLAKELGPVTELLGRLKGTLQTLPGTGGVLGGAANALTNVAGAALSYKMMGGFGGLGKFGGVKPPVAPTPMLLGPNGMPLAPSTTAAATGFRSTMGSILKSTPGKLGIGTLAAAGATKGLDMALGKKVGSSWRNRGLAAAKIGGSALTYAALGSMVLPGIGTAAGAVLGTGIGLAQNIGGLFGQGGGDDCGHGNMPHKCNGGIGGDNSSSSGSAKAPAKTLQMPVPPGTKVTSPFGPRPGAAARNPGISKNHSGIDYGVPVGTKIVAAGDGTVSETGLHRQYGQYVIIKHGAKSTLYAHLSKIMVRNGQNVVAGEVIALSGGKKGAFGAGSSTGPHLHFEVRNNGGVGAQGRVNPKGLFGKAFNFIKNIATKALNFVKQTSNKYLGTNLAWKDSSGSGINLNSKKDLSSINSGSLSTLISNSLTSGSPLDINTIRANAGSAIEDETSYTAFDTSDGTKKKVVGKFNNKEDLVSGDKVGMVGGSRAGLIKMLYDGGFRGKGLSTAFSVALAESGGRAKAKNFVARDLSYGLFQINMKDDDPQSPNMGKNRRKQFGITKNEALYDPMTNIRAAYEVSNKGSWWKQWATFNDGKYTKYLDDASRAAVKAKLPTYHSGSYNVPKIGIGGGDSNEHVAMVQAGEMILPAKLAEKVRNGTGYTPGTTNIKVDMKVNIARSSMQEAEYMFTYFKDKLEKELKNNAIGTY